MRAITLPSHVLRDPSLMRALLVCSVSLAAACAMFLIHVFEGEWTWMQNFGRHFASQASVEYIPFPIAFFLWFRLMERKEKFRLTFSPLYLFLTLLCFVEMEQMILHPLGHNGHQMLFGEGVFVALLIFVPLEDIIKRVLREPMPAFCAFVAATSVCDYYWLMNHRWAEMTHWSAQLSYVILYAFNLDATIGIHPQWEHSIVIASAPFTVIVNANCNGLEGIFLFLFLLSAMLLHDWESFRTKRIPLYYLMGVFYMFAVNAMRIVSFFSLGYWAYRPDAWGWVQGLRDTPVYLFHSYVGWVFYIIAFELFAGFIYREKRAA